MVPAKIAIFLLGAFFLVLAFGIEAGTTMLVAPATDLAGRSLSKPGLGIAYTALIDAVILYTLATIASDFVGFLRALGGKLQWLVTLVLSIVGLIATIAMLFIAFALLILMVTFLLAVPFGTIAYMIAWGHFATGQGRIVVSVLMALKLVGAFLLFVSNPTLIKNKWLLLLLGSSIGATFLLGLLYRLTPSVLVSITDVVGALVAGIIALVWMAAFLVNAIPAFVRAVRS